MAIFTQGFTYNPAYPAHINEQVKAIYEADDYEYGTQIVVWTTQNHRGEVINHEVKVEQSAEVKYRVAAIAEDVEKFYRKYIENVIPEGSEDWRFRREMAIIQYLVENTRYAEERYDSDTVMIEDCSAYGALRRGEAVCAGYAYAFLRLARRCNLEACKVSSETHAWNLVKLDDGQWYNVDVTWEDPLGGNDYGYGSLRNEYINLTDAEIVSKDTKGSHDNRSKGEIVCNSYAYGPDRVSEYMRDERSGANKQRYDNVKTSNEGWKRDNHGWWYVYADGSYPISTWLNIGDKWYYFNSDGYICIGWQQAILGWCYFREDGSAAIGWTNIGGNWYYFRTDASMVTGWINIEGDWYYMREEGSMATGWISTAGNWYYLSSSGKMLFSTTTPDGYRVGADGALIY